MTSDGITYAAAGVNTAAGDRAVELMREAVARTHGPEAMGGHLLIESVVTRT